MVDVYSAKYYKNREHHNREAKVPPIKRRRKPKKRKQVHRSAGRLEYHVARGDFGFAKAAPSPEENPAEHREHIVPLQSVSAGKTVRRFGYYRLMQRSAQNDNVKKAADNRTEDEYKDIVYYVYGKIAGHVNDSLLDLG